MKIIKLFPGILLSVAIAALACWLESLLPIHLIGSAVIAMFIGMFLNQFVRKTHMFASGLKFTSKKILKFAIILLGLSLNISTILHVGKMSLTVMVFTLLTCFGGGYFIGSLAHLFFKSLDEIPGSGTGKTDYLIPNILRMSEISDVLIGIILVLLIAASVSTLSSITITATSTLTMDFIAPVVMKTDDKVKEAKATKLLCLIFVVFSYVIANSNTPILDMMSYSWGIISGSFLAPYALSLYWKKLNTKGAWAGILAGFVTALPPVICKLLSLELSLPLFGKVMDMGPHFACLAMIVSLVMCLTVTHLTKGDAKQNEQFYTLDITQKKKIT